MPRRFTYDVVFPRVLAAVLLLAAALKCHELATGNLKERDFWDTRWFWSGLVEIELLLAIWLFAGLHTRVLRLVLMLMFIGLFEVTLYQGLQGAPSCGCFGKVSVPPWWITPLDGLTLVALILWRPQQDTSSGDRKLVALIVSLWLVLGVPAWFAVHHYNPGGPHRYLRQDRRLDAQVSVVIKHPSQQEILEILRKATGLTVSLADEVAVTPPDYGEVQPMTVPVVSVMEWVAQKQEAGVAWREVDGGYELRRVAWWKQVNSLALGVVFIIAFLIYWGLDAVIRTGTHPGTRKK